MSSALRVLFLAAEADPFFKVGGLGDVAGSLPPVLRRMGVDVRLVLPLHGGLRSRGTSLQPVCSLQVSSIEEVMPAQVYALEGSDLPVYFIAGELITAESPVYSTDTLVDGLKYTFFSLAALELCRYLGWSPDILHANDWHTAPAVYSLAVGQTQMEGRMQMVGQAPPAPTAPTGVGKERLFFSNTASLMGVHNLPYLGLGAETALGYFGLPPADSKSLPTWARQLPLPLGLLTADCIVAVSPSYALEILTPDYGAGLQDLLRQRRSSLSGILNGLDVHTWDPQSDPHLKQNYSLANLKLRQANKSALQSELGLQGNARTPLFAMVSRMDYQKGVDLLPEALRRLAERPENASSDWQLVILGAGDLALEAAVRGLEQDFPGRVRAVTRFDAPLSHRIYAGADVLIIPSRYEPCGMTQMIAMRYGCVPLARATGGLRDTVRDIQQGADSTGFLFEAPRPAELTGAMRRAMRVYQNEAVWQALQLRGMRRDFSWERSAQEYLTLYQELSDAKEEGSKKRPVEV